ncbi:MAG: transporter related protein [Acidimicrobiales bacterium]|nr:transporter related protein [Acidimicrobiales bacterium]
MSTGARTGAVAVRDLHHAFARGRGTADVPVFAGLDLSVEDGEFLAVVGPSGCGKSTLLRMLAGLLQPLAGSATVGGRDVLGRPGAVAFMPQKDNLLPWRRALGNAVLGAEISGVPRAEARARALPLFERFGLVGFERAWPAQLSGGMRQRLALLRTFLLDQPVLLLDEPFGALDAITRRSMQTWLQDVWSADRRTVVFVTHDVEEALWLADRVVVLSGRPGRVVAELQVTRARPRALDLVTDPAFVAQRAEVLAALGG